MISIEFELEQIITVIQATMSDPFKIPINQFFQKTSVQPYSVCFLANGCQIIPERTVESYMSNLNRQYGKMRVFVDPLYFRSKKLVITQSKDVICPECKEPCQIRFENYHINLFGCNKGHIINGIKIDDFAKTQEINISSIICDECKTKNKGNSINQEFFRCLTCQKNLCILCKSSHDPNHKIIKNDQINYICQKHNDTYIKYCKECATNICYSCESEHFNHKTIFLADIRPNIEETKKEVDDLNKQFKEIIIQLNNIIQSINLFYEIINNILKNYEVKNRNYEVLQNIKEINTNNKIIEIIKK